MPDINKLSQEEIEKGFKDIEEGKTKPAAQVFSGIRAEYGRKNEMAAGILKNIYLRIK